MQESAEEEKLKEEEEEEEEEEEDQTRPDQVNRSSVDNRENG
jgi:hypothetical protein